MGKGGKSRNLTLKGIEEEIEDFEDEDEDLTFITNEIIKLLQYRKKDKNKPPDRKSTRLNSSHSDSSRMPSSA